MTVHISTEIINPRCWLTHMEQPLYPAKLAAVSTTMAIAVIEMLGWISPSFATVLPIGWHKMQPTTALILMLLSASLGLKVAKTSISTLHVQRVLAILALIIVCTIFYEHLHNKTPLLGLYLVASAHLPSVHPTSIQSAICLFLICVILTLNEKSKGLIGNIICTLLSLLVLIIIGFVISHLFRADSFISSDISKQSLFCIMLLTAVIYIIRGPYSVFSVIFSTSLGGKFARRFLTITMIALSLVISLQLLLSLSNRFNSQEVSTITVTANIALLFFIIIIAANQIEKQAQLLEQLVITDKLTSTYNLRGLYLHAEQKLLDARRNNVPFSVLMFDLDGLKEVNDKFGHATGSILIKSFATALNNNYRSNDIVARIGGDEFVVITMENENEVQQTLDRFAKVINEINQFTKQPYQISYSIGMAHLHPNSTETIDDLIKAADQKMYAAKRAKKEKVV